MPWVQRDTNGTVIGCYTPMQPGVAEEWLEDDSPELVWQKKEARIAALQAEYESNLAKLNQGWLSTLIANGVGESARQLAIKAQMQDLAGKLDLDILTVIMEE